MTLCSSANAEDARTDGRGAPRPIRWSPLDKLTAGYTACSAGVLLVRAIDHTLPFTMDELIGLHLAHVLLVVLVILAVRARAAAAPNRSVLAEWYPLVVLMAVYGSIGVLNGPLAHLGASYDQVVQAWEVRLLGRMTPVLWGGHVGPTAVTWWLGLSYVLFFPMVIAVPAILWRRGHTEDARRAIFSISLTFFSCYLLFLLFPVAGPAYAWGWPEAQQAGQLPVRMVRSLNDQGDSWGSAFPSSHVAASATAAMLAMHSCRRLGSLALPIALGILGGVVYFQVHYVLDAVAGLLIAGVATWGAFRLWARRSHATA